MSRLQSDAVRLWGKAIAGRIEVFSVSRRTHYFLLFLAAHCLLPTADCAAQSSRDKVSVRTRIGYPPGPHQASPDELVSGSRPPMFKSGGWTPVYVDVQNSGKYDPATDGPAIVSVGAFDSDDALSSYSVPLPPFDEGGSSSVILYLRPGSRYSDITVRVLAKGRELCPEDKRSYS